MAVKHKSIPRHVNELLRRLLVAVTATLKENFVGIYIGGSLANNAFNQETSDIDVYIVIKDEIADEVFVSLENSHNQLHSSGLKGANKIETSYIPQKHLENFSPTDVRPYFNEGKLQWAAYGNNWLIELFLLREKGMTITGPDIKILIPKISSKTLKEATRKNLKEYWEPLLSDKNKLNRADYQVFATLTMCRTLYTLKHGAIISKQNAAERVKEASAGEFSNLIDKAITWKPGDEFNHYYEVKKLIEYTLEKS